MRWLGRLSLIAISLATVGLSPSPVALAGASSSVSARDRLVEEWIPLQAVLKGNSDAFGGLWLDETGRPVVAAVNGDPAVRDVVNKAKLSVVPLIVSVPLSAVALDRLHAAVAADRRELEQSGIQLPPHEQKHWITEQRRASYVPHPGDSGAPTFYNAKAMGIESSNFPGSTDGLYGHIRNVELRWNLQTQLTLP